MKPIDKDSKIGWLIHSYGPIEPKVYFNHMGTMLRWSKKFNMVFIGIDKQRTADSRNILVATARSMKCTHILFVDADHILPEHMLECLSLNNDASIVSGLITKRKPPYSQVGFIRDKDGYYPIEIPLDGKSYLVDTAAMGCTLIDIDIFDTLEEPFFFDSLDVRKNGDTYNKRSDTNFFEKAKAAGYKIIIDSRVLVGHMRDAEAVFPNCVPNTKQLNKQDKIRRKEDSLKYQREVYNTAASYVRSEENLTLLDLGCGHPAKLVVSFNKPKKIVGVDFSEKILDIASTEGIGNWIGHDLETELDLKEKFDLIICADVIEHISDTDMLLENAKRHMSDKSLLVISSPERKSTMIDNPLHVREFSCEELSAILYANGFSIIETKQYQEVAIIPYTNNIFVCRLSKKE